MARDHVRRALALLACVAWMTHQGGKALNSSASAADLSDTDPSSNESDADVELFFAAMQQAEHEKEHDALEHKGKKKQKTRKAAASGKVTASRKTRSS